MDQFNLVPSSLDRRDYVIIFPPSSTTAAVDLRNELPAVYSQGSLNSCTAMAVAAPMHQAEMPSRLFIWYNTRAKSRNELVNAGATIRDAVKAVVKTGACREASWPYLPDKFDDEPPDTCYAEATNWKMELYARVNQEAGQIEGALRSKLPVIFGMRIYTSFHQARTTGMIPRPQKDEKFVGGHAMVIVGCDPVKRMFIVRNSYGPTWGDKGHCYIAYDMILDRSLTYDLWVLKDLDTQVPLTVTSPQTLHSWKSPLDSFSRSTGRGTASFDLTLQAPIQSYTLLPHFVEEWPSAWQILGSDDSLRWQVLHTRQNIAPREITIPLSTNVRFIRFQATRSTHKPNYGFGRRVSLKSFIVR